MKRSGLWLVFAGVQALGAIGATVGIMWNFYFAIIGMVCLLPGYLVAYAFLRRTWLASTNTIWAPLAGLALAIPINALFWYAYSRKYPVDEGQ